MKKPFVMNFICSALVLFAVMASSVFASMPEPTSNSFEFSVGLIYLDKPVVGSDAVALDNYLIVDNLSSLTLGETSKTMAVSAPVFVLYDSVRQFSAPSQIGSPIDGMYKPLDRLNIAA